MIYTSVIVVLPGLFILGVLVFHFLVRPIPGAEPLNQMLLLVGLSLVLQNGALALFSADTRSVQSAIAYSVWPEQYASTKATLPFR